jgi:hypothetical protein
MINLHQRYNHYLQTGKKHDRVNERVQGYGWRDDGSNIVGYYVVTESWVLNYDKNGVFEGMDSRETVYPLAKTSSNAV